MSQFPYKRAPPNYSKVARDVIDSLRARFDFPYDECKQCVTMVVDAARLLLDIDQLEPFYEVLTNVTVDAENCFDSSRFRKCLGDLSDAVLDGQQRSWNLYDDEEEIFNNLTLLRSLTLKADPEVSRRALRDDNFAHVGRLILLYQMETRNSIRSALLSFFQVACKLDKHIITYLVNSSLPPLIASELLTLSPSDEKTEPFLRLLATVFSTGEAVPFSHYGVLNEQFVDYLIRIFIAQDQLSVGIADLSLAAIVAFNLHFPPDCYDNIVVKSLSGHELRLLFMERLMIYFNCRDDPISRCTDTNWTNNLCIVKLLDDIVQTGNLAEFCFKGDQQLFAEIICREITDIEPDERRTAYLKLLAHSIGQLRETADACKLVNETFKIFACENEATSCEDKSLVELIRATVALSCKADE
uniref:DUF2013 domain-containing protein n=1 Tax=Trichuris muris TaxID=70415 RepID=A0A5S6QYH5_TRIMR